MKQRGFSEQPDNKLRGKLKLCLTTAALPVLLLETYYCYRNTESVISTATGGRRREEKRRRESLCFFFFFIIPPVCPPPSSDSAYQHIVADILEFFLDLHAVLAGHLLFLLVALRLLLDAGDDAPG